MVAKDSGIEISVSAAAGAFSSSHAVSLGLIVTELVINALKHAFPGAKGDARVVVSYESAGGAWTLKVSDNGGGIGPKEVPGRRSRSGLGNSIVQALANQLAASVDIASSDAGTSVTVAHIDPG